MSSRLSRVVTIYRYSVLGLPYRNQIIIEKLAKNEFLKSGIFARVFSTSILHKYSIFRRNQEKIEIDVPKYGQLLDSWYYNVKPFGKIQIQSPMAVNIQPLDPQKYPEMDKLFINILYTGDEVLAEQSLAAAKKQYIVGISLDVTNEEIEVDLRYKTDTKFPAVCDIQIPLKYDVCVECTGEGEATLKRLEGASVNVNTEKGNCTCKSIKSGRVDITSESGSIISKTLLQGNLNLTTRNGDIIAGRLQGQEVTCQTDVGNICVKSVYANSSKFTSMSGTVSLNNCHGNSLIDLKNGDLNIASLDGSLKANVMSGSTSVFVAREGILNLKSYSGDIQLKISKSLNTTLQVEGRSVEEGEVTVQNKIETESPDKLNVSGYVGEQSSVVGKIQAVSKTGKIQLFYQDWFSSLNLFKDPFI